MKTIAENANDFADQRTLDGGNCVYVDKRDYFHRLMTSPGSWPELFTSASGDES